MMTDGGSAAHVDTYPAPGVSPPPPLAVVPPVPASRVPAAEELAAGVSSRRPLSEEEKRDIKEEVQAEPRKVVLRVEVARKGQARLLTWSAIVLNVAFVVAAIALLASQGFLQTLGDMRPLYMMQLVLGSVCLGLVACMLLRMAFAVRRSMRQGRTWSSHHIYFVTTAGVFLASVLLYCAAYVAGLGVTIAQPHCSYDWLVLAAMEFLRRFTFSFVMLFLLFRLSNMRLWRGKAALDANPDCMLVVDRPFADRAKAHWLILGLWAVMVAAVAVNLAGRVDAYNSGRWDGVTGCSLEMSVMPCQVSALQAAFAVLSFAGNLFVVVLYGWTLRRAMKDHKRLPFCRYRNTHIFVRVQARVVAPVQVAVLLAVLVLELIPALRGNCMSVVAAQLGNLPVSLSLTVASTLLSVLYMPTDMQTDSPLLNEYLQDFSWSQAAMSADLERRYQRLLASGAAGEQGEHADNLGTQVEDAIGFLPGMVGQAWSKLARVQDMDEAAKQLAKEPIFCMETAIRLFYWSRMAYRSGQQLAAGGDKYVDAATGLPLFDLEHWETIDDEVTDTHCVIGWSNTRAVLAFRGTSSKENALTDLKSWRVRYSPEPTWHGRSVSTHVGFLTAWTHAAFNQRVLDRLREVDQQRPQGAPPLRIWITGHSLGGALAVLASQQISRTHPDSRLTVYTFGCPRVGNTTFAHMFNAAIPDAWSIVNHGDPVTMIPKIGFKRVGQRANVDVAGNLIVRGSYFELSVVHRGTVAKNHTMGQYALALASIMKSQFSASKALPGGASGVEGLLSALDVSKALVMSNVDLESLQDPGKLPVLTEKLDAELAKAELAAAASCKGSITSKLPLLGKGSRASKVGSGMVEQPAGGGEQQAGGEETNDKVEDVDQAIKEGVGCESAVRR